MRLIEENVVMMSEMLPGWKVFPALGNHERAPVNWYQNRLFLESIKSLTLYLQ